MVKCFIEKWAERRGRRPPWVVPPQFPQTLQPDCPPWSDWAGPPCWPRPQPPQRCRHHIWEQTSLLTLDERLTDGCTLLWSESTPALLLPMWARPWSQPPLQSLPGCWSRLCKDPQPQQWSSLPSSDCPGRCCPPGWGWATPSVLPGLSSARPCSRRWRGQQRPRHRKYHLRGENVKVGR